MAPALSRFHEAPEDKRANLEALDNYAALRNGLRAVASEQDHWAGIPMPLDGEQLVIEPTYPRAEELMKIGVKPREPHPMDGHKIRNQFWSDQKMADLVIIETPEGKFTWGLATGIHHFGMDLRTLGCADAWGIEQESNALHTLAELVSHRQFKHYMLTGMFLETSTRSKVTYCFRRLKPTVAMSGRSGKMKILCTLCLHSIGYYSGTWAGAMCPTDDVISHLCLMRGDEKLLWRRANQHHAIRPESGL